MKQPVLLRKLQVVTEAKSREPHSAHRRAKGLCAVCLVARLGWYSKATTRIRSARTSVNALPRAGERALEGAGGIGGEGQDTQAKNLPWYVHVFTTLHRVMGGLLQQVVRLDRQVAQRTSPMLSPRDGAERWSAQERYVFRGAVEQGVSAEVLQPIYNVLTVRWAQLHLPGRTALGGKLTSSKEMERMHEGHGLRAQFRSGDEPSREALQFNFYDLEDYPLR